VHLPLKGEKLVTFLSDGAFEEQIGSDWTPRWWRAEDCGMVTPIMINNGRRIDQRSTMAQKGGTDWFVEHLKLNHFDPLVFDGKDPAAFVWAIWEMERRLEAATEVIKEGKESYPVRLPYGIAVAPKGAGFYNAGENLAHNLPIKENPHQEPDTAKLFNVYAKKLWVSETELKNAIATLNNHDSSNRPLEKDHPLVNRHIDIKNVPSPEFRQIPENPSDLSHWTYDQPMSAVDSLFLAWVKENDHLRPRVGNPDEMKSNRLQTTLNELKFRVTEPEEGIPEAIDGAVITALNEEAVAAAALANKGGISLIATYEAFGAKMHGIMRQEIIFAKHRKKMGLNNGWLSIPLVLTSHTWENGKNEQSHQDTMMAEAMLNESSDISRVLFAADYNTASVIMQNLYQTKGQFWTLVVPKRKKVANLFTPEEAQTLLEEGAIKLEWAGYEPSKSEIILTAIGAYQLEEVLKASTRLTEKEIPHSVVYMLEPGRFRWPRNSGELAHAASGQRFQQLYPDSAPKRVFVTHSHPESILGTLQPLYTGHQHTVGLGFINEGGTLNRYGMLFINRCTWGHILAEMSRILNFKPENLLKDKELKALYGNVSPEGIIIPDN
jgi:phosphoketolase